MILVTFIAAATLQLAVVTSGGRPSTGRVRSALVSNGRDTPVEQVPYHAAIYRLHDKVAKYELLCGATLIAPDLVVTAAHCFLEDHPNISIAKYNVTLGKYYQAWDVDFSAPGVQHMLVKQIILHPRFIGHVFNLDYDVALVKLTSSAAMSRTVQVAQLDWNHQLDTALTAGAQGVVAGWGLTADGSEVSKVLNSISLPYINVDTCLANTPQPAHHLITRGKFCAGYLNSRKSLCPGDSGGGYVVVDVATNRNVVIGVVSSNLQPTDYMGDACFTLSYATFTDLTDQLFLDWIKRHFRSPTVGYNSLPGLGNLYKFHATALTWSAAKTACESEGSHMVILNSDAEFRAVRNQLRQNRQKIVGTDYTDYAWVGVKESDTRSGEFFTVLGDPLSSSGYSTWAPGEPSTTSSLGDVVIIDTGSDGLYDLRASSHVQRPFTCELEVG